MMNSPENCVKYFPLKDDCEYLNLTIEILQKEIKMATFMTRISSSIVQEILYIIIIIETLTLHKCITISAADGIKGPEKETRMSRAID